MLNIFSKIFEIKTEQKNHNIIQYYRFFPCIFWIIHIDDNEIIEFDIV